MADSSRLRNQITRGYTLAEDAVYVGLGLLLAGIVFTLLVSCVVTFVRSAFAGSFSHSIIGLLDQILLILLLVELLYTVQVSFREHALLPEPFLIVGLISCIRRLLVLTAEYGEHHQMSPEAVRVLVIELAVLTVMILALVGSLVMLRRRGERIRAERV
jgi:uncharacterized membrane protein (DUF373 family)